MKKTIIASERNAFTFVAFFATSLLALVFAFPLQADAALLTQELDPGMTNSDVTSLQTFLAGDRAIYPEGIVTGYFGGLTEKAVSRFQSANGLSPVGRVGPQTLSAINSQMNSGGSSGNSGSNGNIGGDIWAPIIYQPETVSVGTNSASISWNTNEASKGRVMYGTSWPFLFEFAPSVSTNVYSSSSNVSLTGLQSHVTYYYVLESIDGSGNVTYTLHGTFFTQ
jgi:peptidoglycan hydrolase-like protein with peptidoglycan-binding domain